MKIAVCISGIPKYWKKSLYSIQKYLPTADVFIHAWDISSSEINATTAYSYSKYRDIDNINYQNIMNSFNTKKYKVQKFSEKISDFKNELRHYSETIDNIQGTETNSISQLSMFYGIREANRLKSTYERDNGFIYDIAFRFRFDSEIVEFINFQNGCLGGFLYIPKGCDWGGINDQFYFGDNRLVDMASECYTFYEPCLNQTKFYGPEVVFKQHLNSFLSAASITRVEMLIKINNEK
jgi:hypothetical protein